MRKERDRTIYNFLIMIRDKISYIKIRWDYLEVLDAKKSKKNWEKVEELFRTELSNLIEDNNPDKDKIIDYALFYLYCASMKIHFGGHNAGKAGYLDLKKEIMDYIYYLIKCGKEKELSIFERGVDLLYEIKNDEKIRGKVSDKLKEYVYYCCFEDNTFGNEKNVLDKIIKEGYSCYYIGVENSPSHFYKWEKKLYKTDYEKVKRNYEMKKIFCDKGYFPEIYRKYFYIIYNDFLKEEEKQKTETKPKKKSIIKRLFGFGK